MAVREPGTALARLHDELDRAFDDFSWPRLFHLGAERRWLPALDVYEKDNNVIVEAELPGIEKQDIKIGCRDHALTIEGETKKEEEEKREGYYRSERRYGRFYRSVPLPEGAEPEKAKAEYRDGVLRITVPKSARPEAATRTIPVE